MNYNNQLEAIRMPEYGRHVQKMVDYTLSIPEKSRRNSLAHTIIKTMRGLVPELAETPRGEQVYWDHLAIVSDFQLDIDYPQGTITKEQMAEPATKPTYEHSPIRFRFYGQIIERMIAKVCQMPMGRERAELEYFIALQMKRNYMTWNSELVEDIKIFKDLYELSQEQIMLTPENCKLAINPNSIDKGGKQKVSKKMQGKPALRPQGKPQSKIQKRK